LIAGVPAKPPGPSLPGNSGCCHDFTLDADGVIQRFATYDPSVDSLLPSAAGSVADVSAALVPRTAEVAADIYGLIVREIPQLRGDQRVLALLEASVGENVATVLHILQHDIDLEKVHAPAAEEYARRLAQRGVPIAALLRAYRIGSARLQDWCLQELAHRTDNASIVSAAGLHIAGILAAYIDRVSEEVVSAYESAKENWLRNRSVARAARVRALLRGERVDVDSSEAILGYRLRQNHVGVVAWIAGGAAGSDALGRLERATAEAATEAYCDGRPMFVPQDETSAWAWLPLGVGQSFAAGAVSAGTAGADAKIRFAFGAPAPGVSGFRRTHRQALSAHAIALAARPSGQLVTSFAEVAPVALMAGSIELLQAWVIETLGALADDDDQNGRLRATLGVFLQENGSYKATAERLTLHKNTVQYRGRKAEESLGRPVGEDRLNVELALLASQWLGTAVLRPGREPRTQPRPDGS
jgi:PucR C-terminal helix-turn-helix domain/GGDEF-like domain